MKSYLRCFDRKAEFSLGRCWDGHDHCNTLTPNAPGTRWCRPRNVTHSQCSMFTRFSNYCCYRLIEDTLYLSTIRSLAVRSDRLTRIRLVLYSVTRVMQSLWVWLHNNCITSYRIPRPWWIAQKELYNSNQGAHFSAFIYHHPNAAFNMTWSEPSRFFKN